MKNSQKGFVGILLILILLIVIASGVYFWQKSKTVQSPQNTAIQTINQNGITILSPRTGDSFTISSTDINAEIPVKFMTKNIAGLSLYLIDSQGEVVYDQSSENRDIGSSTGDSGAVTMMYINQPTNQKKNIRTGQYKIKVCDIVGSNCVLSQSFTLTVTNP